MSSKLFRKVLAPYLFEDDHYYENGPWGGEWESGLDRSSWRTKSDAAQRREAEAGRLFEEFLIECMDKPNSAFPPTKDVVPCKVHLTQACWSTFKKSVTAQGCKAKRRKATFEERIASKDKRKSRMYVITITCPENPRVKVEAAAAARAHAKVRAEKAKAAAAAKAEKAKAAAAAEAEFQAAADAEVKKLIARQRNDAEPRPAPGGANSSSESLGKRKRQNEQTPSSTPASAGSGAEAIPVRFFEHAVEKAYASEMLDLHVKFAGERMDLLKAWEERQVEAEKLLLAESTRTKAVLLAKQHVIE